jgi:hypothetical protein
MTRLPAVVVPFFVRTFDYARLHALVPSVVVIEQPEYFGVAQPQELLAPVGKPLVLPLADGASLETADRGNGSCAAKRLDDAGCQFGSGADGLLHTYAV